MAKQYQPNVPFNVPFKILYGTSTTVNGVRAIEYIEDTEIYYCSTKSYVGSVKTINDLSVEETRLIVDSYWFPKLKKNDRVRLLDDDTIWELNVDPENINRRNQYSRFTMVRIHG